MKIALYGRTYSPGFNQYITQLLECFQERKEEVYIFKPLYEYVVQQTHQEYNDFSLFHETGDAPAEIDFLFSIGGDGTFLESISYLQRYDIPVIGLNSGRLGFLANISKEEVSEALQALFAGNYQVESRSLLELHSDINPFGKENIGLNDTTIQKQGTSLLTIDAYINNEFLNTYWTDGLIISTPTGSTAYNLAVGGPIVVPGSRNLVLSPIASHNLTVRPVVVPDDIEIRLEVKSRSGNFLVSVDNRSAVFNSEHNTFYIRKARHELKMVCLPFNNYYSTLRNKLMWGVDKRN